MIQSHLAAAIGLSNFCSQHAEAGPDDSLSVIYKLLVDTATERTSTKPLTAEIGLMRMTTASVTT